MSTLRRAWRRCSGCGGVCHWHDTDWVCGRCGDEWGPDHGQQYSPPVQDPEHWEAVKAITDRRKVAYWRMLDPDRPGRRVGAVSRHDGGWHALGYRLPVHYNQQLGIHHRRREAEREVSEWATNPDRLAAPA